MKRNYALDKARSDLPFYPMDRQSELFAGSVLAFFRFAFLEKTIKPGLAGQGHRHCLP